MNFKQFLEEHNPLKIQASFSQNTVGSHNDFATSTFLPSTWTGSENLGSFNHGLPSTDLNIPTVTRNSKIRYIEKNKNPIKIMLLDGTKLFLTFDEFNRINSYKKLDVGQEINVTFQRQIGDKSLEPSKIIKVS